MVLAALAPQLVTTRLGKVMWLIPYESFTVQTRATPEELVRRLRPQVARQRSPLYWRRYQTDAFFQGRIRERGFTLMEVPPPLARGPCAVAYGRFIANPEGTSVRVRLTLIWSLWAFFGVLWYPVIAVGLFLSSQSSNGIPATTANPLVTLLVLLSLFIGPWLMYVPSFWSDARAYRAELERLLAYQ